MDAAMQRFNDNCEVISQAIDHKPEVAILREALLKIATAPAMTIRPKDGVDEYKDDYLQNIARDALAKAGAL